MQKYVHGGDVYSARERIKMPILDFSANLNPLGMPQRVKEAAEQAIVKSLCYPDPFCRKLVEAIAKHEKLAPSQVICGNGAADLIFRLVLAVKPKQALLLAPSFAEYEQALASASCQVIYHSLKADEQFLLTEAILPVITPEIDLLFLCNPNNPTGQLIDKDLLAKIIAKCGQTSTLLVVDECFNDFLDNPAHETVVPLLNNNLNLFVLKAFTKLYAMAGLRLGYGLSSNLDLLDAISQSGQPWSVSTPAQAAGLQALAETEFVAATSNLIAQERAYLKQELQNLGFVVYGSLANYIFFKAPTNLAEGLENKGILIRKCGNYPGLDDSYYRIAVRLHTENQILISSLQQLV